MLYSKLAELYEKLESTSKRLEKTEILANFLSELKKEKNKEIIYLLQGRVFPVNPKDESICGLAVYKSVLDIPEPVDLVFVTTPAGTVPGILEECGEKGVKGVVLITSGFSETDEEGKELERCIVKICREKGLMLIGPNTMGIICPYVSLFATGSHTRPRKGTVAFVSQSGNLGLQLIHWAEQQGIGVSVFVGSGNEAMYTCTDYLEYVENDPNTSIIILYVESVADGRHFLEAAKRINQKKPLIVLKGGRLKRDVMLRFPTPVP